MTKDIIARTTTHIFQARRKEKATRLSADIFTSTSFRQFAIMVSSIYFFVRKRQHEQDFCVSASDRAENICRTGNGGLVDGMTPGASSQFLSNAHGTYLSPYEWSGRWDCTLTYIIELRPVLKDIVKLMRDCSTTTEVMKVDSRTSLYLPVKWQRTYLQ